MPHYKEHKLAGEDHRDVALAEIVQNGDALVWRVIHTLDLTNGVHVPGIDPNLTELSLDEEMMPIEFYGLWIPGQTSGGTGGNANAGSRAFAFFMG